MAVTEKRKKYLKGWRERNRDKTQAANKRWYEKNHEQILARAAEKAPGRAGYYQRWREENIEDQRKYHREYYHKNKERLRAQAIERGEPEKAVQRVRDWREANPAKRQEQCVRRRASKINATPKWLTPDQKAEMQDVYIEARLKKLTVDHIIPLKGKTVCGLHVPWNLQLLSRQDNARKGNRLPLE